MKTPKSVSRETPWIVCEPESFYTDGSVMYFSTHQYPHDPDTGLAEETGAGAGIGTNFNVPLAAGNGGNEVLAAYRDILLPAANRVISVPRETTRLAKNMFSLFHVEHPFHSNASGSV